MDPGGTRGGARRHRLRPTHVRPEAALCDGIRGAGAGPRAAAGGGEGGGGGGGRLHADEDQEGAAECGSGCDQHRQGEQGPGAGFRAGRPRSGHDPDARGVCQGGPGLP